MELSLGANRFLGPMQENSKIERLDASHVGEIILLWDRAGLEYKPGGRDERGRLRARIKEKKDVFFGIFEKSTLVAVALVTNDGRKGWINRVAVDPMHRRKGLAKRLIRRSEEYLRSEGIRISAALVEDWNEASLRLFQSCGYVIHKDIHYMSRRKNGDE